MEDIARKNEERLKQLKLSRDDGELLNRYVLNFNCLVTQSVSRKNTSSYHRPKKIASILRTCKIICNFLFNLPSMKLAEMMAFGVKFIFQTKR